MSDNFKKVIEKKFRYYQEEADNAIYEELLINNKCIVKMFCGTGKSLLMRKCKSVKNQKLVVYVFPSLPLIDQFCNEYFVNLGFPTPFKISSENDSTTDPTLIKSKLKEKKNKIICVTYQSYNTLLDNLGSTIINVCIYDEAHHAVAPTYQKLIFETNVCEKQIFFTATPKDDNGIIMCDKDAGICGRTVYDYSYLRGLNDEYVNPFEIRVDMYTENTNKSVYESIARAILVSENNRVLTFHADVNTDRDTSVINFVNESEFVKAFIKVLTDEFPEKAGLYTNFKMIVLDASIKPDKRRAILNKFDTTLDNEVYIISSCETIGEGIDTKNANMCVFVDPKSSFVKIIQNIGRIVRRQSKPSTVLIPCWVDKTKYVGCDEDREKCDEVIRSDLNTDGNFNGILNVLSALRQEDEDLYDVCLNYGEDVDDKSNYSSSRDNSDSEDEYSENSGSEYDDCDDELEKKPKHKINISFHTNDEIKVLWKITSDIDIMKNMCSCVLECEVVKYDQMEVAVAIVERAKERERNGGKLLPREIYKKIRITSELEQENKDAHKLGRLKGAIKGKGTTKCRPDVCYYLDKELFGWRTNKDEKRLQKIYNLVERAKIRAQNGENLIPIRNDKDKQQYKDATLIQKIKNGEIFCLEEMKTYLDLHLPEWNLKLDEKSLKFVKEITERAKKRKENGCELLPKNRYLAINNKEIFEKLSKEEQNEILQEHKDNKKLDRYKQSIKGLGHSRLPTIIKEYLDINLPEWNLDVWKETLLELKIFIDTYKKRPSNKDKDKKIKDLGVFLTNNKSNFIDGKLKKNSEENYNLFKEFYEDEKYNKYIQDRIDIINIKWKSDLSELKEFINENNRLPSSYSKNSKEKILGNFITNKQRNYKGKLEGMKDEKKYNDWSKFLEEYKQYFNNIPDSKEESETEEIIIIPKKKSMKLKEPSAKKETQEQRQTRTKSELSVLHQRYKTLTSQNLQKEFQETPDLWHKYHAISEENEKSFPEEGIPRNRIIQELTEIKGKRTRSVVDMGCGKAHIAKHFANDKRFSFINYDHVSSNENVLIKDVSNTELEDDSVNICILCLAMWGSNCHDYVREAYRILDSGGFLYIMEATKRWTNEVTENEVTENESLAEGSQPAYKLKKLLEESGFQIVKQSVEKFCMFVCTKL